MCMQRGGTDDGGGAFNMEALQMLLSLGQGGSTARDANVIPTKAVAGPSFWRFGKPANADTGAGAKKSAAGRKK